MQHISFLYMLIHYMTHTLKLRRVRAVTPSEIHTDMNTECAIILMFNNPQWRFLSHFLATLARPSTTDKYFHLLLPKQWHMVGHWRSCPWRATYPTNIHKQSPLTIFCQNFHPFFECGRFIWFLHYLWRLSLIFVHGLFMKDAKKCEAQYTR